jgi:hypothetical protein
MSNSLISLGLGFGGGKASTSNGRISGGGATPFTNTYSVDFDGTDDYVGLGNISSLSGASDFTINAWVKTSTLNKYIYSSYDSGLNNSIQFYFHSGGGLRAIVGTGVTYYQIATTSTTLADGTWKNFSFVFDGGNFVKIYVNGVEEASSVTSSGTSTVPSTTATNAGNTPRIGDYVAGGYALNGLMDEFSIFNSALSASDIAAIYNSGTPNDISSLNPVGWWRMGDNDSGTGTTITDQGSGGNDGTLTNGPTFSTDVPS